MKKLLSTLTSAIIITGILMMSETASLAATLTSGNYKYGITSKTDKTCYISGYTGTETELDIPTTLGGYTVTRIGYGAFGECTSLTRVFVSSGVTNIGSRAFYGCTSLETVNISDGVTSIGELAFYACPLLTDINVSENSESYSSEDGVLFNKDKTELICYPAGKVCDSYAIPDGVKAIGSYAFGGCVSLTSITIPDSVTNIENFAFSGCGISYVYYSGTKESWQSISTGNSDPLQTSAVIACSDGIINCTHDETRDEVTKATCTNDGTKIKICTVCDEILESEIIPAKGHDYGNWEIVTAATAKKDGVQIRTCSICGSKETKTIAATGYVSMYRLYNPNSGEHFYTANAGEKDNLVSLGWTYEGIGWNAPKSSSTPVYRLYNAQGSEHHYTTNAAEKDNLVKLGWSYEGIGWYSDDNKGVALYRQYNPNAYANNHNYTTNLGENNYLVSLGWQTEGIGWYGC